MFSRPAATSDFHCEMLTTKETELLERVKVKRRGSSLQGERKCFLTTSESLQEHHPSHWLSSTLSPLHHCRLRFRCRCWCILSSSSQFSFSCPPPPPSFIFPCLWMLFVFSRVLLCLCLASPSDSSFSSTFCPLEVISYIAPSLRAINCPQSSLGYKSRGPRASWEQFVILIYSFSPLPSCTSAKFNFLWLLLRNQLFVVKVHFYFSNSPSVLFNISTSIFEIVSPLAARLVIMKSAVFSFGIVLLLSVATLSQAYYYNEEGEVEDDGFAESSGRARSLYTRSIKSAPLSPSRKSYTPPSPSRARLSAPAPAVKGYEPPQQRFEQQTYEQASAVPKINHEVVSSYFKFFLLIL